MKRTLLWGLFSLVFITQASAWGFYGHQRINRLAVFTLPPEMLRFYKFYLDFLTESAVAPDNRRYTVAGEAPRHYIDVDVYDKFYNDSAVFKLPRYWKDAVAQFSEDTLQAYGIVPWHISLMKYQLTEAFRQKDTKRILRLSAEIGHYIADANVPLHTTENYNGQKTNQIGIHGFWESRLVELYSDEFDFFVGQAVYIENPQLRAWQAVIQAHTALDSVFRFEQMLTAQFPTDKKYTFEQRNRLTIRTYSREFSKAYYRLLDGQVERQMRAAIKMIGDFWLTCWIDAGQPSLNDLLDKKYEEEGKKELENEKKEAKPDISRPHEGSLRQLPCCQQSPYLAYYRRKVAAKEKSK
jgi:hypothetical protein